MVGRGRAQHEVIGKMAHSSIFLRFYSVCVHKFGSQFSCVSLKLPAGSAVGTAAELFA